MFEPRTLTVSGGTTVQWVNADPLEHTVTADDGSFDSGLLGQGTMYSRTFTEPGTYAYYCIPHGSAGGNGMAGTIIVTDSSAAATSASAPSAAAPVTAATSGGPGTVAAGAGVYQEKGCSSCHGPNLDGQGTFPALVGC